MRDARRDVRRDVKESLTHKATILCEQVIRQIGLILSDAICDMQDLPTGKQFFHVLYRIASRLVSSHKKI
jgi:hypothetical protein